MAKREVKVFLSIILTMVLLCGIGVLLATKTGDGSVPVEAPVDTSTPAETTTEPLPTVSVSFLSVGDNLIHDGIYQQANKRAGGNGYDFSYCYKNIAPDVAAADVATINQETIISKSNKPSGYPLFNSPHEVGDEIAKIGFDVIAMANNHMIDKGAKGLSEAIDYWDSVDGVVRTGAYKNEEDLNKVEYIESNGLKIGLVGVTQYTNGLSLPKDSELKIIYSADEDIIERKIKNAKENCDMVLVNIHWGNEYQTTPTQAQKDLASKMANWGADVIIGHHPHVIQPVEFIEKADGTRTLVAYSLGNFISQQNTPARVVGGMLHYTVTKDFNTGKLTVSDVKFEPIVTHYVNGSHDVQIFKLSQYNDDLAKRQSGRLKDSKFSVSYIKEFVSGIIDGQFLDS